MGRITTVEERMKSEAEFGLTFLKAKITKKKAKELREKGFEVIEMMKWSSSYPKLYYISWKNAASIETTECTEAQKLWVISKRNQPKSYN